MLTSSCIDTDIHTQEDLINEIRLLDITEKKDNFAAKGGMLGFDQRTHLYTRTYKHVHAGEGECDYMQTSVFKEKQKPHHTHDYNMTNAEPTHCHQTRLKVCNRGGFTSSHLTDEID